MSVSTKQTIIADDLEADHRMDPNKRKKLLEWFDKLPIKPHYKFYGPYKMPDLVEAILKLKV